MTEAGGPVDTLIEDARWEALGLPALADRAAAAALEAAGLDPGGCEIGLLAADDARIAALNAEWRGKQDATNVLSWPSADGPALPGEARFLGDLALAFETCAAEAEAAGVPAADHVTHLVVHGVLHLVGHDHEDDGEAEAMEALERKVLASLGVADPYSR
ncbi:rRNA maturation RNase YbeY [Amaricoccus sp.]|uniref:rRNA maturation RNase YbeY n=1 Tax=Amaricoccus sp. TaxID=1872485 RepID=UPI001B4A1594|nr:rRNA maturation RNase YbeY [Amaricoccus sp.]MBP7241070.1 rRNA maturation RNase YbeY [Amaricoccus sp.]